MTRKVLSLETEVKNLKKDTINNDITLDLKNKVSNLGKGKRKKM